MRGKHVPDLFIRKLGGITPAHAGKTRRVLRRHPLRWDHPRACGENLNWIPSSCSILGSPPRMRGKQGVGGFRPRPAGITPAHAGKTNSQALSRSQHRDHPRACGENADSARASLSRSGSPPRMRGKLHHSSGRGFRRGITPAHAGKTSALHLKFCFCRDHPRACGENTPVPG